MKIKNILMAVGLSISLLMLGGCNNNGSSSSGSGQGNFFPRIGI